MNTICRIEKREQHYVQIDNRVISDSRLSFKAKGILAYLLSKPNNWTIRITDLVKHSPTDGVDSIQSGLRELSKIGYAKLEKGGPDGGSFWRVFESPIEPKTDKPKTGMSEGGRQAENPTVAKPDCRINGTLSNTDLFSKNGEGNSKTEKIEPEAPLPAQEKNLSPHHAFIAGWCQQFNDVLGKKYVFVGEKDGKIVKNLLASKIPIPELLQIAKAAWELDDDERFLRTQSMDLAGFASQINKIRGVLEVKAKQKAREYERDMQGPD